MGDYRFIKEAADIAQDTECSFCFKVVIKPGGPYYLETERHQPFCCPCARLVREVGETEAKKKIMAEETDFKRVLRHRDAAAKEAH